ncbi:MAG: hypothetical protein AAF658_21685, partial [Myxococcota bacterium]
QVREGKDLPPDAPVKVDVVAHSMGGLVLRYYLRYGTTPLPEDGSLPALTWAGAQSINHAYLIGTPNAGAASALERLVDGMNLNPLFPNYRPAVLGTMPAVYQLLPRVRHARVIDLETNQPVDFMDVETWEKYEWGLADPNQDWLLEWLLPNVSAPEQRRQIALDHLAKCLAKAEQLFSALDNPASPPPGTEIHLFAGDGIPTSSKLGVRSDGSLVVLERAPGDDTVTRASALMDERTGNDWTPTLESPIDWNRVQFLADDHLGMTSSPEFLDNLLYLMLESPRE